MALIRSSRRTLTVSLVMLAALFGGAGSALLGLCGSFTDVAADSFCPFVLEIFTIGITTGTSPTTYDPTSSVSRLQMAAFLSRTVDSVLKRGSHRGALRKFWTTQGAINLGLTTVGTFPELVDSDGSDLWVANTNSNTVSRVRGSDGKLLETWTGAQGALGVLSAMGKIFATGFVSPGQLYKIDPSQPAGGVTTVATNLGNNPLQVAFDGGRIWTANQGPPGGSVSIVTPDVTTPWTVTTVTTGFNGPVGVLYDGAAVWVTDLNAGTLLKLDPAGAILLTITVGTGPEYPTFDGANIWVPNYFSDSVSVVRASNGAVLATLTGNGLNHPVGSAFDGQRVLIANNLGNSVSLWKAADLTTIGTFVTAQAGTGPFGASSDGISFWITLRSSNLLARF